MKPYSRKGRYAGTPIGIIEASDVGRSFSDMLPTADVEGFGHVCKADVGKAVFNVADVIQIENIEQRNRRWAQEITDPGKLTCCSCGRKGDSCICEM